ncbi:hypothetical protein BDV38DRAFT_234812 [Aspergillus pseudotamarii]|uniref:Uncharacterized protein n=1 Tax=Aspergillus pseudotamarii TaxID=132259 RepID=A0A5N6T7T6_ASPPS|nr:uncharacterized protein BDV38DRAFT_234812 [Aspergillus pseudotamarii]KAE8142438.1 hypothetical protein BDV38DRAFT_234812 [Aspergillus pseudotamarii]
MYGRTFKTVHPQGAKLAWTTFSLLAFTAVGYTSSDFYIRTETTQPSVQTRSLKLTAPQLSSTYDTTLTTETTLSWIIFCVALQQLSL